MADERSEVSELAELYGGAWGEHPSYPVSDWRYEVECGDTRRGYWDWVASKIEQEGENGAV